MADAEYINALVNFGRLNLDNLAILKRDFAALYGKIQAQEGRQISGVTIPGQTVAWSSSMTVQEQFAALSRALDILNGRDTVIRRTTMRRF